MQFCAIQTTVHFQLQLTECGATYNHGAVTLNLRVLRREEMEEEKKKIELQYEELKTYDNLFDISERKELIGVVVSDKADKTITVKVETYKKHPLYGKRVKYSKKYAAHDENNMAHVGDKVRLAQTRPLSKTKRYELVEVIEKAVIL